MVKESDFIGKPFKIAKTRNSRNCVKTRNTAYYTLYIVVLQLYLSLYVATVLVRPVLRSLGIIYDISY